jgi:acyl-coenzyme A thioesterase PaaI-like protein
MPIDPAAERRCRTSFARQQAMVTIGASVTAVDAGSCEITPPFAPHLTQQHGFIHAGVTDRLDDGGRHRHRAAGLT